MRGLPQIGRIENVRVRRENQGQHRHLFSHLIAGSTFGNRPIAVKVSAVSHPCPAAVKVGLGCAPWKGGTFPVGARPTRRSRSRRKQPEGFVTATSRGMKGGQGLIRSHVAATASNHCTAASAPAPSRTRCRRLRDNPRSLVRPIRSRMSRSRKPSGTDGSQTRRWRKRDSNPWSQVHAKDGRREPSCAASSPTPTGCRSARAPPPESSNLPREFGMTVRPNHLAANPTIDSAKIVRIAFPPVASQ
jgi:hypothetical protein